MGQRREGGRKGGKRKGEKGREKEEELGVIKFLVSEERRDGWWCFNGEVAIGEGLRVEGEGAVVEHQLGVVIGKGGRLDAKVAEHCVRFPTTEELSGIFVHSGA